MTLKPGDVVRLKRGGTAGVLRYVPCTGKSGFITSLDVSNVVVVIARGDFTPNYVGEMLIVVDGALGWARETSLEIVC